MAARNALYVQSGGVTAVINASACGLIEAARRHPDRIGRVLAGRDGLTGVLAEDLIDTSLESAAHIAALRHTPGGAFGSCRRDLPPLDDSSGEYERFFAVLAAHDIGYFFCNGGNGSMDTALKVARKAAELGYPLQVIGVPKTVDNDIMHTDCCPGFGSAAKYVATSMREAGLDIASMARSSTRVFVFEVMGRNCGWLTAAAGLAAEAAGQPPHLLLLPEIPFVPARFLAAVGHAVRQYGYCAIAAAEGLVGTDGRPLAEAAPRDAAGHVQLGGVGEQVARLAHERLGLKHHSAKADYLQRAARHLASATDLAQAYAVGEEAIAFALAGESGVMVAIERLADAPYEWRTRPVPLAEVANFERRLPAGFVTPDGFHITDIARRYLFPLIAGEAAPPYREGLPEYVRLDNHPAPRRLAPGVAT